MLTKLRTDQEAGTDSSRRQPHIPGQGLHQRLVQQACRLFTDDCRRSSSGRPLLAPEQWARARRRILKRLCWSGSAVDKGRHPIQDQIKAKLEVVLKIGLRIGWRRLKDPGIYHSSQHWKSALVNQPSEELTVWQR